MQLSSLVKSKPLAQAAILVAGAACLTPYMDAGIALLTGVILALIAGNPFLHHSRKLPHFLLGLAIIGMGAGMNLKAIGAVGLQGGSYTVIGISVALIVGLLLKKMFGIPSQTAALITVGTAICGGSAIAAVAPVIRAKHHEISAALGTVFILNAAALFIFPEIGKLFDLSETQFGLWSALAIHDTSSVVGATLQYGTEALQVGTTVKLARALWIIPVAFLFSHLYRDREASDGKKKLKKPWFILGFCLTAALVTWFPTLRPVGDFIAMLSKQVLILALFLIGLNLTRENLQLVGIKPFLYGIVLWIVIGTGTLGAIMMNWIQ